VDNKPALVFVGFMLIAIIVIVVYLIYTDPFRNMPQHTRNNHFQSPNREALILYSENCATCHGATGEGKDKCPPVRNTRLSEAQIQQLLRNGKGKMPSFSRLDSEQIINISRLVKQF